MSTTMLFTACNQCEHAYTSTVTKQATCTTDGLKTFTCSRCGDIYTETISAAHSWIEATCKEPKHCSKCPKTEGQALGHAMSGYSCTRCDFGYGRVTGTVTWKYNDYLGTRGDDGAEIILIPKNKNSKEYNNKSAAIGIAGSYDSGIMVAECDGNGNYDFGYSIPVGEYVYIILSDNTRSYSAIANLENWQSKIRDKFGNYFSSEDLETLVIHFAFKKYSSKDINITKGMEFPLSYYFGTTDI